MWTASIRAAASNFPWGSFSSVSPDKNSRAARNQNFLGMGERGPQKFPCFLYRIFFREWFADVGRALASAPLTFAKRLLLFPPVAGGGARLSPPGRPRRPRLTQRAAGPPSPKEISTLRKSIGRRDRRWRAENTLFRRRDCRLEAAFQASCGARIDLPEGLITGFRWKASCAKRLFHPGTPLQEHAWRFS